MTFQMYILRSCLSIMTIQYICVSHELNLVACL